MFLTESAYLLHDNVAGKSVIQAVDGFLGRLDWNTNAVVSAALVAQHVDIDDREVATVLDALAHEGALVPRQMVLCPNQDCATFTPAEKVEQARAEGDEAVCDGPCGQDLAARDDLAQVTTYRLIPRTDVGALA